MRQPSVRPFVPAFVLLCVTAIPACGGDATDHADTIQETETTPCKDEDRDEVCDNVDVCLGGDDRVDADHDGTPDYCDACPADPNKDRAGTCGCGVADTDSDHDTVPDCHDACAGDDLVDQDADGVPDACDPCPHVAHEPSGDSDGDHVPDACDPDLLVRGDLVISEVMPTPAAVDDAHGEWFELTNTTTHELELKGLTIHDDGTDTVTIATSLRVPAGSAIVVGRDADLGTNGGVAVALAFESGLALDDTDQIVLANGGVELDRVAWTPSWPFAAGVSMRFGQRRPQAPGDNADAQFWCASEVAYGDGDRGSPSAANGACPELRCADGGDDNGDGAFDCHDASCAHDPVCDGRDWPRELGAARCSDGKDNDGDGLTDCAEPGCAADPQLEGMCGPSENTNAECSDGADNDHDGHTDCDDPGCAHDAPGDNGNPAVTVCLGTEDSEGACGDHVDNDRNGQTDCDDGGCHDARGCGGAGIAETDDGACVDHIDNDGDGAIDCADPDCASRGLCSAPGPGCADPTPGSFAGLPDGTACDVDACTLGGVCVAAECLGALPMDCSAGATVCADSVCQGGSCVAVTRPESACDACDEGGAGVCEDGQCHARLDSIAEDFEGALDPHWGSTGFHFGTVVATGNATSGTHALRWQSFQFMSAELSFTSAQRARVSYDVFTAFGGPGCRVAVALSSSVSSQNLAFYDGSEGARSMSVEVPPGTYSLVFFGDDPFENCGGSFFIDSVHVEPACDSPPWVGIDSPSSGPWNADSGALGLHIQGLTVTTDTATPDAGAPVEGHYHVFVDGVLQSEGFDRHRAYFSGLTAGPHTVTVELVTRDHQSFDPPAIASVDLTVADPPEGITIAPSFPAVWHGAMVTGSVTTTNVVMDPDVVGGANVSGHGHAHLYLDGELARDGAIQDFVLYNVAPGQHLLEVRLADNDHAERQAVAARAFVVAADAPDVVLDYPDDGYNIAPPLVFVTTVAHFKLLAPGSGGDPQANEGQLAITIDDLPRVITNDRQWSSDSIAAGVHRVQVELVHVDGASLVPPVMSAPATFTYVP